jgi:hypothetical protein
METLIHRVAVPVANRCGAVVADRRLRVVSLAREPCQLQVQKSVRRLVIQQAEKVCARLLRVVRLCQRLREQQLIVGFIGCVGERNVQIADRLFGIALVQRLLPAERKLPSQRHASLRKAAEEKRCNRKERQRRENQHQQRETVPENDLASRTEGRADRSYAGGICLCVDDVLLKNQEFAKWPDTSLS